MPGLKLDIEKTRAIWIGSMNKSNPILCNDFKLDWNQGPFIIYGVTFTAEVFDMWDKNTTDKEQKKQKVENIIKT